MMSPRCHGDPAVPGMHQSGDQPTTAGLVGPVDVLKDLAMAKQVIEQLEGHVCREIHGEETVGNTSCLCLAVVGVGGRLSPEAGRPSSSVGDSTYCCRSDLWSLRIATELLPLLCRLAVPQLVDGLAV